MVGFWIVVEFYWVGSATSWASLSIFYWIPGLRSWQILFKIRIQNNFLYLWYCSVCTVEFWQERCLLLLEFGTLCVWRKTFLYKQKLLGLPWHCTMRIDICIRSHVELRNLYIETCKYDRSLICIIGPYN